MKNIPTLFTRRSILMNAAKFAGAALIPPGLIWGSPGKEASGYAPKLSVEGYIWTQYFATQKVTLAEGEEEALRETHQAGYTRVELSSDFFTPEVRNHTRELLAKYQLNPESVYAGTTLHEAARGRNVNPVGAGIGSLPQALGNPGHYYQPQPQAEPGAQIRQ